MFVCVCLCMQPCAPMQTAQPSVAACNTHCELARATDMQVQHGRTAGKSGVVHTALRRAGGGIGAPGGGSLGYSVQDAGEVCIGPAATGHCSRTHTHTHKKAAKRCYRHTEQSADPKTSCIRTWKSQCMAALHNNNHCQQRQKSLTIAT